MEIRFGIILGSLAAAGLAPAASAATSLSGSMNLRANSSIAAGSLTATDHASNSFVGVPVAMGIFALASINDGVTGGNVTARGQGQASGTANAGTVHFQDYGWSFNAPARADAGQSASLADHSEGDDWSYTFMADSAGSFQMSYDTFVSVDGGQIFGLWGWDIEWSGAGGGQSIVNVNDPTAAGLFTRSLLAGETYTVSLRNNANLFTGTGNLSGSGYMGGTFNYQIKDAVPEPTNWALMLIGFGGIGSALRARRRAGVSFA